MRTALRVYADRACQFRRCACVQPHWLDALLSTARRRCSRSRAIGAASSTVSVRPPANHMHIWTSVRPPPPYTHSSPPSPYKPPLNARTHTRTLHSTPQHTHLATAHARMRVHEHGHTSARDARAAGAVSCELARPVCGSAVARLAWLVKVRARGRTPRRPALCWESIGRCT